MTHTTTYTYGQGTNTNADLANDLLTITSPNGQPGGPDAGAKTVNAYDNLGRVTSQTDPMKFTTTFNYCVNAAAGNCMDPATGTGYVTITDPDQNKTVYDYTQGTLAAETHLAAGAVSSEQDYNPITWIGSQNGGTLLDTSITDGDGNTTSFTYDSAGDLTSTISPGAAGAVATSMSYASTGDNYCDGSAAESSASTCAQNNGPTPVAPGGTITPPSGAPPVGLTYALYDTNGNELYSTTGIYAPGGSTASYVRTTYQLFNANSVSLNGTTVSCAVKAPSPSLPCATINANGIITQLGYDSAGEVASSTTPDGNGTEQAVTTYTYNLDGEQTSLTNPDGNLPSANAGNYTTVTAYNADGHTISVTQAGGSGATVTPRTTTYGYDANNNPTTVTDARNYTTTTAYNADNKTTLVTDPDGNTTLTCYDGDGRQAQFVPPVGVAAGKLTPALCPSSYPAGYSDRLAADATVTMYNASSELLQQTTPGPSGQTGYETTTYAYDGNGNLIKMVAPPAVDGGPAITTVSSYDSNGKLTARTIGYGSPAESTTAYCYDPAGDRTAVVAPDGNTAGLGRCETASPWVIDSNANPVQASYQTTYQYDSVGDAVSTTTPATAAAPNGATTSSSYDPAGNMVSSTDPNGVTTTNVYSPTDLLTSASFSGSAAHQVTYAYDANGAKTGMTDATGTSSYSYDSFGELTSATGGSQKITSYAYDSDGNVTGTTYPLPTGVTWASSDTVGYGYDNADRLTSVTDFSGGKIAIADTPDGLPAARTLGSSGDTITSVYDNTDKPASISLGNSSSTLQSFTNSNAPSGGTLTESDSTPSSTSAVNYSYDGQNRVTSMTPDEGSTTNYGFDASGNLTTLPNGAASTYDHAAELTSATLAGTATTYAYDADGSRLAASQAGGTVAAATWNGAGQLTAYQDGAAAMSAATYDGAGLRTSATITPSGGSAVTENYIWSGSDLLMDSGNAYIYVGGTAPAEQVNLSTGAVTYLLVDSLGSVRGTINSSGALTATTAYDAWGNPQSAGGLTVQTPFGYAGSYTDSDGLLYLINRYYDPATGQFTSVDPLLGQTQQPYAYTGGNPVNQTDPSGLCTPGPGRPCPGSPPASGSSASGRSSGPKVSVQVAPGGMSGLKKNMQHYYAVLYASADIAVMLKIFGYSGQQVLTGMKLEMVIPGGNKKFNGNDGRADITWTFGGLTLVWEVKSASLKYQASFEAMWYVECLQKHHIQATEGFDLRGPIVAPNFQGGFLEIYSFPLGIDSGGIVYTPISPPVVRQPVRQPVRVPDPQPNEAPNPALVLSLPLIVIIGLVILLIFPKPLPGPV